MNLENPKKNWKEGARKNTWTIGLRDGRDGN